MSSRHSWATDLQFRHHRGKRSKKARPKPGDPLVGPGSISVTKVRGLYFESYRIRASVPTVDVDVLEMRRLEVKRRVGIFLGERNVQAEAAAGAVRG